MKMTDHYSHAGGAVNEDALWYSERCALVLDGSTSLEDSAYPASVFVKDFIGEFSVAIAKTKSLCAAVNMTIEALKERVCAEGEPDAGGLFPSAAGVFVYETDTQIQMLTLGDCTAVFVGSFGVRKIYSPEVEAFDSGVINRMAEIREATGADMCDIVRSDEIREMLVENRRMMNRPGGYRILSLNTEPVSEEDIITFDKSQVDKIILYSDGFELMEKDIISGDTEYALLYQRLREKERADASCNEYPRFKQSDDASILSLKIIH